MRVLAIESSCDETSVAVVTDGQAVLCNVIATSSAAFQASGGVIPEEAARKQVEAMLPTLALALSQAQSDWQEIDAIAVTKGPGLLGSLLVGTVTARALASIHQKPLIPVHHTLGHLSSTWLNLEAGDEPHFPILTLSASGGHTELWYRTSHTHGMLIGHTRDDAAGEAYDKGAMLLGLPYPGGPSIAKAAESGDMNAFDFPMPLKKEDTLDFSFSGLKTALRYTIRDLEEARDKKQETNKNQETNDKEITSNQKPVTNNLTHDLAASFQAAINLHLLDRIKHALDRYTDIREVHIVGGVSANTELRRMANEMCGSRWKVRWPVKLGFCTDNAAMIAAAAFFLKLEHPETINEPFSTEASLLLGAAVQNS